MSDKLVLLAEIPNDRSFELFRQVFDAENIHFRVEPRTSGRADPTMQRMMSLDYYRIFVRQSEYIRAAALWEDIQKSRPIEGKE